MRRLLVEVVPRDGTVKDYEVGHDFPSLGKRCMLLNARKVFRPGNHVPFLLLTIEDVTVEREARSDAERGMRLAPNIVDTVRDPLVVLGADMSVVSARQAFLCMFGVEVWPHQAHGTCRDMETTSREEGSASQGRRQPPGRGWRAARR